MIRSKYVQGCFGRFLRRLERLQGFLELTTEVSELFSVAPRLFRAAPGDPLVFSIFSHIRLLRSQTDGMLAYDRAQGPRPIGPKTVLLSFREAYAHRASRL